MVAPVPAQISKLPPCPSAAARRRSLPHPPRTPRTTHSLFVAPARCGGPLFSSLSKSLFLQPLYFHIPPNPPGVGGLRPSLLFAPLCTLFRVVALCFQSVAASFRQVETAMTTINRQELERLERRELQLTIIAAVFVFVLASGLAIFMYPLVFVHPDIANRWTLRVAFFGFCALTLLFIGYLLERQSTVRKLKQQI